MPTSSGPSVARALVKKALEGIAVYGCRARPMPFLPRTFAAQAGRHARNAANLARVFGKCAGALLCASWDIIVAVWPRPSPGTWCSGITSASHADGPGFKSQCVHIIMSQAACDLGIQARAEWLAAAAWRGSCGHLMRPPLGEAAVARSSA